LRRLESELQALRAQSQPLRQQLPKMQEVVTATTDARNDVTARKRSVQDAQATMDENISVLKTTIVSLNDANIFWSKLSDLAEVRVGPDLDRLARDSRRWLSTQTVPASFSAGVEPPSASNVRESLVRFATMIDGGHSLTQATDASVCAAGSR